MFPHKRKRQKMGVRQEPRIRCPAHLAWVRGHECAVHDERVCFGKIEAAHVRMNTDGGMGVKPSDCYVVPLCARHHREQHQVGEHNFWTYFRGYVDPHKLAAQLWQRSPARIKYEKRIRERKEQTA